MVIINLKQRLSGRFIQCLACFVATIACFDDGLLNVWPSPAIPKLVEPDSPILIAPVDESWIASLALMSLAIGAPFTIYGVKKFGNKNIILLSCLPVLLSWILVIFATSAVELYMSRFIAGFVDAMCYVAVPGYVGEIAEPSLRGILSSLMMISFNFGVIITYYFGYTLPLKTYPLIVMSIPIIVFIAFYSMPQSPSFLISIGKVDEARKQLELIRDYREKSTKIQHQNSQISIVEINNYNSNKNKIESGDKSDPIEYKQYFSSNITNDNSMVEKNVTNSIDKEFDDIKRSIEDDMKDSSSFIDIFRIKVNLKATILLLLTVFIWQCSGIVFMTLYLHTIVLEAKIEISEIITTTIYSLVQFVSGIISLFIVDRYGRKPLLYISCIGSAICLSVLGLYFFMKEMEYNLEHVTLLPLISLISYIFFASIGLGIIPIVYASELFAYNVQSYGGAFLCISFGIFGLGANSLFNILGNSWGLYINFWLFAAMTFLGALLTYLFLPETKNKSRVEIQNMLMESSIRCNRKTTTKF